MQLGKFKNIFLFILCSLTIFIIFFVVDKRNFLHSLLGSIFVTCFVFIGYSVLFSNKFVVWLNNLVGLLRKKRIKRIYAFLVEKKITASLSLNIISIIQPGRKVALRVGLSGVYFFIENVDIGEFSKFNNNSLVKKITRSEQGILLITQPNISNEHILLIIEDIYSPDSFG